jgi:hypothetical protein
VDDAVRARSWAVAGLVAHVLLAAVVLVVSLVLLAVGAGEEPLGGRAPGLVVGVLVVVGTAIRFGTRPQTRAARWVTVLGLAVVGPWVWVVLWVAGLSAASGPLLGVLPLYLLPWFGLLVVAAAVVATVDLGVGELRRR